MEARLTDEQRAMAEAYLPAAEAFVRRTYKPINRDIHLEFMSAAGLGLTEAALRFDPEKGENFWTYARWYVWKYCNETIDRLPLIQQPRAVMRGEEEVVVEVVAPLVETEEDMGASALSVFGQEETGYGEVEDALMLEWVNKTMGFYSRHTQEVWLGWKAGEHDLPADEDQRACVLMLDQELTEGLIYE